MDKILTLCYKNKQAKTLIVLCCFSLGSCSPKIYFPDRTNAPMLREAGEVKLNASVKVQNNANAAYTALSPSLDLAGSPCKNLGLMLSYRRTSRFSDEESIYSHSYQDNIQYTGNRIEFGAGYYHYFGGKGLFEFYGGWGTGAINRKNLRGYSGNYQAGYYQVFIQPAVGFSAKEVFEFSGGMKFRIHKFTRFHSDAPGMEYEFTDPEVNLTDPLYVISGPFMNFNAGYRYVKFNLQAGADWGFTKPWLKINSPFYLSIGLNFSFAPRYLLETP